RQPRSQPRNYKHPIMKPSAVVTNDGDREDNPEETYLSRALSFTWWLARDQWFIITLLILILVASQVQAPDQQLRKTAVQYSSVTVIFLVNGCTVSTEVLLQTLRLWHFHIMIQCGCFLFTSATALAVVQAAATKTGSVDAALLNGFVIMGCLPTALSFNVIMTKKANGNDALTLTESVLGSLIAPALSTVLITTYASIDSWYTAILPKATPGQYGLIFAKIFKQLGLTLFLPLFIGQLLQYFFPKSNDKVMNKWKGRKLASFSLLVLIWSAFDGAFASHSFATLRDTDVVFLVLVDVGLLVFWMAASLLLAALFLSREDAIAVAFCVPTKTPALGVPLVTLIFAGVSDVVAAKLYLPMIILQCVQTCIGSLATIPLKKWQARPRKGEKVNRAGSDEGSSLEAQPLPRNEDATGTAAEEKRTEGHGSHAGMITGDDDVSPEAAGGGRVWR
ncbi:sodium bile acid symporter family protein, partial [Apiospora arundinis]